MTALYECTVRHTRVKPLRHAFTYRTYQWFVDLDDLPRNRWLASFEARDHLGDPRLGIRQNVDAHLAAAGIDLAGGRVTMLANARALGHVFNPLSVFWCHDAGGKVAAVIAEVHNTYGGRHCYLLRPDERGRAETAKAFYVSPFNEISGSYRLTLPEPGEELALAISLDDFFVATLRGRRRPVALRPLAAVAVTLRIRIQGIRLYLKGLKVVPRVKGAR